MRGAASFDDDVGEVSEDGLEEHVDRTGTMNVK